MTVEGHYYPPRHSCNSTSIHSVTLKFILLTSRRIFSLCFDGPHLEQISHTGEYMPQLDMLSSWLILETSGYKGVLLYVSAGTLRWWSIQVPLMVRSRHQAIGCVEQCNGHACISQNDHWPPILSRKPPFVPKSTMNSDLQLFGLASLLNLVVDLFIQKTPYF